MKLPRQDLDTIGLIIAIHDPAIDRHRPRVPAHHSGRIPPLQVLGSKEGLDGPRMRLDLPIPEPHLLAIGQENERDLQLLGIGLGLRRRIRRVGG